MTPEEIADQIVRDYLPNHADADDWRTVIRAALVSYGDARAYQEQKRCIKAAEEVVMHILATTVVSRFNPATYDGGKRVGARDVLSALMNLD